MLCEVGEGTVHRLWEPLADKQCPPNGYAAKFATPYCIAAAFLAGDLGLDAFTDDAVADAAVRALASKVRYRIDPDNPYPQRLHRPYQRHAARRPRESRNASRTCAAGRMSRSPAPSWRRSSRAMPEPVAGRQRALPMPWRSPARCSTAPSIWEPGADEADATVARSCARSHGAASAGTRTGLPLTSVAGRRTERLCSVRADRVWPGAVQMDFSLSSWTRP